MNIKEYVKSNSLELRKLLKELCLIPAPSHHEEKRAEFCKAWLEAHGAKNVYIDKALNVVFPLNCEGSDEITVLAAHMDTVFPDMEPLPYREDDEKIYCPGVGDDTVCVVDLMLTAKYFLENNIVPKDGILFVCNSCEEGLGNLKGTRQIMKDYAGRVKQFVSYDACIYEIFDGCVGSTRYKVTAETEGGHSYYKFGNTNAVVELSKIISEIYKIEVPKAENIKTTYNVGLIEGGTSINTIPQKATMYCEYRSDGIEQLEIMKEHFERIFKEAKRDGVKLEVEVVGERPCANIDAQVQNAFAKKCGALVKEITNEEPVYEPSSTDCNVPLNLGIPSVAVGAYIGENVHTREEWLLKSSIDTGLEIVLNVALGITNNK